MPVYNIEITLVVMCTKLFLVERLNSPSRTNLDLMSGQLTYLRTRGMVMVAFTVWAMNTYVGGGGFQKVHDWVLVGNYLSFDAEVIRGIFSTFRMC